MVKTVFFGTPQFAIPTLTRLLDSLHPVLAVITQPDRPRGRGRHLSDSPVKRLARERGVPVLQPQRMKDVAFLEEVAALGPDVGVVAAYGKILPDRLLDTPPLGIINVHASLLPKYRGAAPVHRAIVAGETETGVTIIRLVRKMDAGPMLTRGTRPIGPDETSETVEAGLAELGADLLMKTLVDLAAGRATETNQDHAAATLAPRLTKADGLVNWNASARVVHDQVRGLHPWPHAHSYMLGSRYLILRTRVIEPPPALPAGARAPDPGEVLEASGDRLIVATGSGTALAIIGIQPEGRRPLPTRAFLAGHRWERGRRFQRSPTPS